MMEPPASITYSSVVSRDSVRLVAFLLAALNRLEIMACDIGNAYLNAPCQEKIWFVAGPEFGSRQGTVIKVVRALYGLKTSGASWRAMFNNTIQDMGFKPSSLRLPTLMYISERLQSQMGLSIMNTSLCMLMMS
jgi:hypothetical protein